MKTHCYTAILALLCLLGSFPAKAASTGRIAGQVIEKETMKPVAYAEVVFESGGIKVKVSANEYGYYDAKKIPTGKYQMRVNFNNRTFLINNIKIYDSFSASLDFVVSSDNELPVMVEVPKSELIKALENHESRTISNNCAQLCGCTDYDALSQTGFDMIGDQPYFVKSGVKARAN